MAIKISGSTIIDDSRVLINTGNVGVGTTNPSSAVLPSNNSIVHAGIVTANNYYGNASNLTGITAGQVGAIADIVSDTTPQLGGNLDLNSKLITGTGGINVTGVVTATSFSGSGANLTNLPGGSTIPVADESSDTTCFPLFATSATGSVAAKTDASGLKYDSSNERLETTDVAVKGAVRYENSGSTERFEILYNETTDSLDFTYSAS